MKNIKRILTVFFIMIFCMIPIYATETDTYEEAVTSSIQIVDGVIQREERITIEGYEIPEEVNRTITDMNDETLSLIEKISICGKTTDFYFFVDNSSNCTIPYNYINMFATNYTPFQFFLTNEAGGECATINTNGATMNEGEFPLNCNIADGGLFKQISFNASGTLNSPFILTLPCYDMIGYNCDLIENGEVVNTYTVEANGTVSLYIENFDTKTLQFYEIELPTINEEELTSGETATDIYTEDKEEEQKNILLPIIILSVMVVALAVVVFFIFKKGNIKLSKTEKKAKDKKK